MFKLENIFIRASIYEDINSIYELSKSSFTDPWSLRSYIENFKSEPSKYFSLIYKNTLIGFLSLLVIENEITITNIAIDKVFRHNSIGKIFLNYVLNEFERYEFFLEVRESNTPAINLYKYFNFVEIGKRINYYKNPIENALVMKKF